MNRNILAVLVAAAMIAVPMSLANGHGEPNPNCDSAQQTHSYGAPLGNNNNFVSAGTLTAWDGSADLACPDGDGEYEYGFGGAMFPAVKQAWHDECGFHPLYTPHHYTGTGKWYEVTDFLTPVVASTAGGNPTPPIVEFVDDGQGGGEWVCQGFNCACPGEFELAWLHECDLTDPAYPTCNIPDQTTHTTVGGGPTARNTDPHWTGFHLLWVDTSAYVFDEDYPCADTDGAVGWVLDGATGPTPNPTVNPNCLTLQDPNDWTVTAATTGTIFWP